MFFSIQYLKKFDLAPIFSEEEFKHWFKPRTGIIDSFIVENKDKKITDMVSYYSLPSSVMHHEIHKTLRAAYSFYNVSTATPWLDLIQDALISARNVRIQNYLEKKIFHKLFQEKIFLILFFIKLLHKFKNNYCFFNYSVSKIIEIRFIFLFAMLL